MSSEFADAGEIRRVLYVSYEFPPKGGSGVQRGAKFVKYLPAFGWIPTVLTVADPPTSTFDDSLLADIPPEVKIETAWSMEPTRVFVWARDLVRRVLRRGRVEGDGSTKGGAGAAAGGRRNITGLPLWAIRLIQAFFIPDEKIGWKRYAVRAGMRIIARDDIEVVFASGPPSTTWLVGAGLARRSGLPLIADFRDPWVDNARLRPPTALHAWAWRRLERRVVRTARFVVTTMHAATEMFRERYPDQPPEKFVTITNGFDPDDFRTAVAGVGPDSAGPDREAAGPGVESAKTQPFTITHSGVFYGPLGLSGFLNGLRSAIESGAIPPDEVRVRMVGPWSADVDRAIRGAGMTDIVEFTGYVSHADAVRALSASDVLLLVLDTPDHSATTLPGKLIEYVVTGRAILAVVYEGEAADLVRESGAGVVVHPDDVDGIAKALGALFKACREGTLAGRPNPGLLGRFDRRALAEKLARVLATAVTAEFRRRE